VTTRRIAFQDERLQDLLHAYQKRWSINSQNYQPPAHWIGAFEEDTLLAVIGFTPSPDNAIVYVGSLLCIPSRPGIKAMKALVKEFVKSCLRNGVKAVLSQVEYYNKSMQRFVEGFGLRPLAVTYAVTREEWLAQHE
jgi:hypothetical protein